jgi:hypothetical protein
MSAERSQCLCAVNLSHLEFLAAQPQQQPPSDAVVQELLAVLPETDVLDPAVHF